MGEEPERLAKSPGLSANSVRTWAFNVELLERQEQVTKKITETLQ